MAFLSSSLFFEGEIEQRYVEEALVSAPASWWVMPPSDRERYSSGCGPDNLGIDLRSLYGTDIYVACQIHDYMYALGGSEDDRIFADAIMRENMMSMAMSEQISSLVLWERKTTIHAYYVSTRSFGWIFFHYRDR